MAFILAMRRHSKISAYRLLLYLTEALSIVLCTLDVIIVFPQALPPVGVFVSTPMSDIGIVGVLHGLQIVGAIPLLLLLWVEVFIGRRLRHSLGHLVVLCFLTVITAIVQFAIVYWSGYEEYQGLFTVKAYHAYDFLYYSLNTFLGSDSLNPTTATMKLMVGLERILGWFFSTVMVAILVTIMIMAIQRNQKKSPR